MLDTLDVNFHGKRHTDFDLKRIIKAQEQGFDIPVTAYLCGVSYPIHEPHLPRDAPSVYRGISGEQFHGNNAS